jgi:hypothetical protein
LRSGGIWLSNESARYQNRCDPFRRKTIKYPDISYSSLRGMLEEEEKEKEDYHFERSFDSSFVNVEDGQRLFEEFQFWSIVLR